MSRNRHPQSSPLSGPLTVPGTNVAMDTQAGLAEPVQGRIFWRVTLLATAALALAGGGMAAWNSFGLTADPEAKDLLDSVTAAYAKLRTYQSVVTLERGTDATKRERITVQYQQPGHAALLRMAPERTERIVTDGKQFVREALRGEPAKDAGQVKTGGIREAFAAGQLAETALSRLLAGERGGPFPGLRTLEKPTFATVGGIPMERIHAIRRTPDGEEKLTLDIGRENRLIYRVERQIGNETTRQIETYNAVRTNQPLGDSLFAVHPVASRAVPAMTTEGSSNLRVTSRTENRDTAPARESSSSAALAGKVNFGAVSPLDEPIVKREFHLKNTTDQPMTVTGVSSSCGCMSALLDAQGNDSRAGKPVILAPGEETTIRVSINLSSLAPGNITKTVTAFSQNRALARFELSGKVLPVLTYSPSPFDLKKTKPGATAANTLTVTIDSRLAVQGAPKLVSSRPGLQFVPLPETGNPESDGKAGTRAFQYRVTVAPDALLGTILASATMELPSQANASKTPLRLPTLPLAGEIIGSATVSPSLAAFGAVDRAEGASCRISVQLTEGRSIRSVTSASPFLEAVRSDRESSAGTEVWAIRLKSGCPPGTLKSELLVTLDNGERLSLPVTGYVSASAARGATP